VPQFLVRYLREAYVPDAVMIYGAYVDNAAIPPTAEAPSSSSGIVSSPFQNWSLRRTRITSLTLTSTLPTGCRSIVATAALIGRRCRLDDARDHPEPANQQILPAPKRRGLRLALRTCNRYPVEDFRAPGAT